MNHEVYRLSSPLGIQSLGFRGLRLTGLRAWDVSSRLEKSHVVLKAPRPSSDLSTLPQPPQQPRPATATTTATSGPSTVVMCKGGGLV